MYITERQGRADIKERNEIKQKIEYDRQQKEEKRLRDEADKAIKEKRKILEGGLVEGESETNLRKRKAEDISSEMKAKEQRDALRYG